MAEEQQHQQPADNAFEATLTELLAAKTLGQAPEDWGAATADGVLRLLKLKAAHRALCEATEALREATGDAKSRLDQSSLQLQNLLYEKQHYEREIASCRAFRSAYTEQQVVWWRPRPQPGVKPAQGVPRAARRAQRTACAHCPASPPLLPGSWSFCQKTSIWLSIRSRSKTRRRGKGQRCEAPAQGADAAVHCGALQAASSAPPPPPPTHPQLLPVPVHHRLLLVWGAGGRPAQAHAEAPAARAAVEVR